MIKALRKSIISLEQPYDEEWQPLTDKPYDALKEVIIEESLFLGAEGEKALNIYLNFLGRAVYFPEDPRPDDKTLRNIYEFLNFMSERIREYFRKRVGLSSEANPLLDVNLIAACLLMNESRFKDIDFPTKPILKFQFDIFPSALVDKLKENLSTLKSELTTLISFSESDREEKKYFFRALSEARYYLKLFDNT
jgi:hypothetical protein